MAVGSWVILHPKSQEYHLVNEALMVMPTFLFLTVWFQSGFNMGKFNNDALYIICVHEFVCGAKVPTLMPLVFTALSQAEEAEEVIQVGN